jgi:hypothetical protein
MVSTVRVVVDLTNQQSATRIDLVAWDGRPDKGFIDPRPNPFAQSDGEGSRPRSGATGASISGPALWVARLPPTPHNSPD